MHVIMLASEIERGRGGVAAESELDRALNLTLAQFCLQAAA